MNIPRFRTLCVLVLVTPLLYAEPSLLHLSLPDAFNFPKRCFVEALSILLFIFLAYDAFSAGGNGVRWNRPAPAYLSFLAWQVVSLSWAHSVRSGVSEIARWICYGIVFLAAANECVDEKRREAVALTAVAAGCAVSFWAIMQYCGLDISSLRGGLHRVYSTLGNPNYLASYLALTLPLGYRGWLSSPFRGVGAAVYFLFSLLGTAALFITGSRGGMAALFAGLALGALIVPPPMPRRRLLPLAAALGLLAVFLLLPSPANRYDAGALKKLSEFAGRPRAGTAWRLMAWKIGLRAAAERPLLGYGPGAFNLIYLPRLARFMAEPQNSPYAAVAEGGIDYAHNEYLELWVGCGLVGLALLAWFICAFLREGIRSGAARCPNAWIAGAMLSGCFAFLAEATVSYPFHLWASASAFFVFAGALSSTGGAHMLRVRSPRWRLAAWIVAAAAAAASSAALLRTAVSEVYTGLGLSDFYNGRTGAAEEHLKRAAVWQPSNGQARFFLGMCLSSEGNYEEAEKEMRAAFATYSRQAIYVELAKACGKRGDTGEALRLLDLAHAMLPRNVDAVLAKGNIFFGLRDYAGAACSFREALSLDPASFDAARNLAVSLDAMDKKHDALAAYRRAIALRPRDAGLYVNMGALCARHGEKERAEELWREALSIDPGNEMARENLKRLDTAEGMPRKRQTAE